MSFDQNYLLSNFCRLSTHSFFYTWLLKNQSICSWPFHTWFFLSRNRSLRLEDSYTAAEKLMSSDEQFFSRRAYPTERNKNKKNESKAYINRIPARKIRKQEKETYRPTIILNLHYSPFLSTVVLLPFDTIQNIAEKWYQKKNPKFFRLY